MPYPHDDHNLRSLLNLRSACSAPLSPARTADTFSMRSPQAHQSPAFTQRSESPSCYSRSRVSMDGTCSEVSADDATTSGHFEQPREPELRLVPVVKKHGVASNTVYRDSYVDPLRDSSEDERTGGRSDVPGSRSDETLSDASMLRPVESDTSISTAVSGDGAPDPRLSFLGLCLSYP